MAETSTAKPSIWRRKIAGIPVIYLAGAIVGVLAIIAFRMRNTNAETPMANDVPMETDQNTEADTFDTNYDASYAAFQTKGSITAAAPETATQEPVVETNESWLAKAVQWNIKKGVTAGTAQNALQTYLSGSDLTVEQSTIRDNTIAEFGLPPDPPSRTSATPNAATPTAARNQGPLPRAHRIESASDNTYAKIASIYYPSSDKTSVDLLRNANRGRLVTDGPWRVGTYVQVPKYVTPKYYMSTKKTDTEAEIAAKNGISRPSLRALNPGMKFPVKAGTRVRVR